MENLGDGSSEVESEFYSSFNSEKSSGSTVKSVNQGATSKDIGKCSTTKSVNNKSDEVVEKECEFKLPVLYELTSAGKSEVKIVKNKSEHKLAAVESKTSLNVEAAENSIAKIQKKKSENKPATLKESKNHSVETTKENKSKTQPKQSEGVSEMNGALVMTDDLGITMLNQILYTIDNKSSFKIESDIPSTSVSHQATFVNKKLTFEEKEEMSKEFQATHSNYDKERVLEVFEFGEMAQDMANNSYQNIDVEPDGRKNESKRPLSSESNKPNSSLFKGYDIPGVHSFIKKLGSFNKSEIGHKGLANCQVPSENYTVVQNQTCSTPMNIALTIVNENETLLSKGKSVDFRESKEKKCKAEKNSSKSGKSSVHDSMTSVGSHICRICMTAGKERLIKPCNCKGSMGSVHLSCLERWLNQVGRNYCELCGFCYPSISTPRYTLFQSLRIWFSSPRNRVHFQSDCMIFWLLTTVTAGLLAVCIMGTHYFAVNSQSVKKQMQHHHPTSNVSYRVTETAMDFFMAVVLSGYSFTVYLLWKDHYVTWKRWRRANVNVRLLISDNQNS